MEHKLIRGGEQYLPFARSRLKALRATGIEYASQQFVMPDGATVQVRVTPGHDYIELAAVIGYATLFSGLRYPEVVGRDTSAVSPKGLRALIGYSEHVPPYMLAPHVGTPVAAFAVSPFSKKHLRYTVAVGAPKAFEPAFVGITLKHGDAYAYLALDDLVLAQVALPCTVTPATLPIVTGPASYARMQTVGMTDHTAVPVICSADRAIMAVRITELDLAYSDSATALAPGVSFDGNIFASQTTTRTGTSRCSTRLYRYDASNDILTTWDVPGAASVQQGVIQRTAELETSTTTPPFSYAARVKSQEDSTATDTFNGESVNVGVRGEIYLLRQYKTSSSTGRIYYDLSDDGGVPATVTESRRFTLSYVTPSGDVFADVASAPLASKEIVAQVIPSHDGKRVFVYRWRDQGTSLRHMLDVFAIARDIDGRYTFSKTVVDLGTEPFPMPYQDQYKLQAAAPAVQGLIWSMYSCYSVKRNEFMPLGTLVWTGLPSWQPAPRYIQVSSDGRKAAYFFDEGPEHNSDILVTRYQLVKNVATGLDEVEYLGREQLVDAGTGEALITRSFGDLDTAPPAYALQFPKH